MSVLRSRGNWAFPLILAVALGGVSFWLDRITEVKTVEIPLNPKEPKYVINTIHGERFDDNGQLSESIQASAARQFPQQTVIYIDNPDMSLYKNGTELYRIQAKSGQYYTDSRKVDLLGQVNWLKHQVGDEPEGQLQTSILHVDTQTQVIKTDAPVAYRYGMSSGTSQGFEYDKQRGFLNLPARVRAIIYDPHSH
ncbi:LPS export ABC transporter periplasmic protein LptC [Snodgrassella sp. B3800]|uniref:LPS export ABC transporter periplasmic protein LptC n=1 Tax=Snodgrassella TaxID=1193515 RepID=UPI000C1EECE7|nr:MULTISPECIES: LPS export ABC transporter periplasmic protein LptC [Snodgrassella]MCX8746799.1 LPS export ABC transporter periplasmic protein LptC [Snodgrassella sp. B3800]PIT36406.1 LPS export ABC transporter periplasmic protein LptC [Snodgrassella alvi]